MTYRSFFAQLNLYPTSKVLCFTMLCNQPDTPKNAPCHGGIYSTSLCT